MSTNTQPKKKMEDTLKKIIVVLIMFLFPLIPPFGEMTELGMHILGIFIGAIYGWILIGFTYPSIVAIVAFCFSGAFPTSLACFQAVFASDTAVMMLACCMVCAFIEKIDISAVIIGWLLNLKIAKKNPMCMVMLFFFGVWLVASLSAGIVGAIIFAELYREMTKQCNVPARSMTNSFFLVGIVIFGLFGELAYPFRPTAMAATSTYASFTGAQFPFGPYLMYVTTAQLAFIVLYVLFGRFILRINLNQFTHVEVPKVKANNRQIVGLICIVLMMIGFLLSATTLPFIGHLKLGGTGLLTLIVMMTIPVDGKPLLSIEEIAGKFNWGIYIAVCFILGFVGFIGSPLSGITATVKLWCAPLFNVLPPFAVVAAAILLGVFFTNFMNNLPVAIVFISLMFAMESSLPGVNMAAATVSIILGTFVAAATPAASGPSTFAFGLTDLVSPKNQVICGTLTAVFFAIVIIFIYYPLVSLVL